MKLYYVNKSLDFKRLRLDGIFIFITALVIIEAFVFATKPIEVKTK